jgi:hypothetical protein
LYQKKLLVMDMVTPFEASCVLFDDRSKLVEHVTDREVETALPQSGGNVKVVVGSRKGETGILRERNSDKNRCLVEMHEDGAIEKFRMDDVALVVN